MRNLIEYAKQYNQFGFNVIPLEITSEGKKPSIKSWKHLQNSEQSFDEIENLNWGGLVNGIGGINNKIASLDFDKCKNLDFIITIAQELGIDSWIVQTGFGFHLHLIIKDIKGLEEKIGSKSLFIFTPKDASKLKQCELRIKNCYTALPPSKHFNGSEYIFISGHPKVPPQSVSSEDLIVVLLKYFNFNFEQKDIKFGVPKDELMDGINKGVPEGERHRLLVSYACSLLKKDISVNIVKSIMNDWNKKNIPPLPEKEIDRQVTSLYWEYFQGLNRKFHQFENILMSLNYDVKTKLKMILCYSVIEYSSDGGILNKLDLVSVKNEYHKICKHLIQRNNDRTQKNDQIVRVGEDMILDVIKGKIKYDYFSVYIGIISFLGRTQPAKRISNDIITYRSIGFKDYSDWYDSECTLQPPSRYIINKAVKYLEDANFIRTFALKKGQMKFYSTRLGSKEELANYAVNCAIKRSSRQNSEEDLRRMAQAKIYNANRKNHRPNENESKLSLVVM